MSRPTDPAFDHLRELVVRRAKQNGCSTSVLPSLMYFRADAPNAWQPGLAMSPMVGVVVQGRKQARHDEGHYEYGVGDYFVLTAESGFDARVVEAAPECPYLSLKVDLPSELIVETAVELPASEGPSLDDAFVARLDHRIVQTLIRLVEAADDIHERRVLAPLALRELVFLLLRSEAAHALRRAAYDDDDRRRVRQAMAFIREHAGERLTVEGIARGVGMSSSHFAHRFRAIARVSPMRYVKTIRLHRARVLLLSGSARPSDVAHDIGYGSASHFSRDFKALFGLPPAEYVRQHARGDASAVARLSFDDGLEQRPGSADNRRI